MGNPRILSVIKLREVQTCNWTEVYAVDLNVEEEAEIVAVVWWKNSELYSKRFRDS